MINILPTEEKDALRREYWMRFASVAILVFTLTALFASILLLPSYFFSASKESLSESRLEAFNKTHGGVASADLEGTIRALNTKLQSLLAATPKKMPVRDAIDPLLTLRADGIGFNQILYSESTGTPVIELYGVARDRTTLRDFKQALDDSSKFTSVDLPLSDFIKKSNIDFTISLSLK